MPADNLQAKMPSKRKRDETDRQNRPAKRQRRRKRSRSVPLMNDPNNSEKRQALKRLFGRICSVEMENKPGPADPYDDASTSSSNVYGDENDDPLLDSVPEAMDPEQLGFLVCAQETLRFLHGRGLSIGNPVFSRLRMRLIRGIDELAMA